MDLAGNQPVNSQSKAMKSAFLMASFMISTCSPKLFLFTSMTALCYGQNKNKNKKRRKKEGKLEKLEKTIPTNQNACKKKKARQQPKAIQGGTQFS